MVQEDNSGNYAHICQECQDHGAFSIRISPEIPFETMVTQLLNHMQDIKRQDAEIVIRDFLNIQRQRLRQRQATGEDADEDIATYLVVPPRNQ